MVLHLRITCCFHVLSDMCGIRLAVFFPDSFVTLIFFCSSHLFHLYCKSVLSFCFAVIYFLELLFVAHCPFPEIVPFSHALCFPFAVMLTDPGAVPKNAVPLSPSFKMHLSDMSKTKYTSADDKHMIATTGAVVCMRRSGYKHVDLAINSVTARCISAVLVSA